MPRHMIQLILCIFAIVLPIAACQTTASSPVATTPPAGAVTAVFTPPPVGTKWIYEKRGIDGSVTTVTTERLADGAYQGQPALHFLSDPQTNILDIETGNWIATLGADQKPINSASPYIGRFDWPLWVGKKWSSSFEYIDHVRGRTWDPVIQYVVVEAYEEVTVPAGSYNAFRLQTSPGRNNSVHTTIWIAPDLGITVKEIIRRSSSHYLGAGTEERTLRSYIPATS